MAKAKRSWTLLGLALAAGLTLADAAVAAPRRAFNVAAQPLGAALLDLAIQADISIGLGGAASCRPLSPGVRGEFTVAEALDRILAGTRCGYQMIDASSARIVRARPAPQPNLARPSTPRPLAPAPEAGPLLPEVVVTATRRSALAMRLPDAISVVSGARMALARDSSIGDLAGGAPGLTVTNLGPGADKAIIRGLSDGGLTGHTQSTVGIYLDGTRLTYSAPDPDLRLTDVAQVEVLQGPQGALYGAGSIAGVVHIATRQPNLEQYGGMLSVTGAVSEGGGPSGVVEGVANLPIVPGRLALRAVVYDERDGGYVDDPALGRKNTNTTDRSGARLALKLNLNGEWSVDVGAVHQALASADSQYASHHMGAYRRRVQAQEPHSNDFDEAHVTISGQVQPGQFKNTLSLIRHDIDTRYDVTRALPLFDMAAFAPPAAVYDEDAAIEAIVDEATLTSAGAAPFQWLLGGFVSDARQTLRSRIFWRSPVPSTTPIYAERRTDEIQEYAVYGEASYDVSPRLSVGLGARIGAIDVATSSVVSAPDGGAPARFRGHIADLDWSPKLSVRYQVDPRLMTYLLVSKGDRGGGFNTGGPVGTVFGGADSGAEPFRRFKGDDLWNFEAGVKLRALSDRLDLRATAFYDIWSNIQSDQLLPSGLPYTANIGDGRNFGLEFEAAYVMGDVEFRFTGLLDEPELTRHTSPFPALLHSGLPGAPRGTVGAAVHYEPAPTGPFQPFFDASIDYVGQSRLSFDATTSRRMGDYARSRLTGGVETGAWRAALFVDNPLGVTGDTFAYGNPFTLRHTRQITPLPPRTAGLQLTRSF